MPDMLDVFGGRGEPELSIAHLDADAIRDTPYQGPLPTGEHSSGIRFCHENADAWAVLAEELPEDEYQALWDAVEQKVGPFEVKYPLQEESIAMSETGPVVYDGINGPRIGDYSDAPPEMVLHQVGQGDVEAWRAMLARIGTSEREFVEDVAAEVMASIDEYIEDKKKRSAGLTD